MRPDKKLRYIQEIRCEDCKVLVGYAPYWRLEYVCVPCNKKRKKW